MKKVSLLEFLKTRSFGGVRLGMTEDEVLAQLGEPEGRMENPDSFFISYGWWEIFFIKDTVPYTVTLIMNKHLLYDSTNHDELLEVKNQHFELQLDFIKPFEHVRLKELVALLESENIPHSFPNKDFSPAIQLENGVFLDVTDTEPTGFAKEGIRWGPGRGQRLQKDERRIEDPWDFILCAIGIGN